MDLIEILLALLILVGTALCVYLILWLKQLLKSLDLMRNDLHKLTEETLPVIEKMNQVCDQIINISSTTEKHFLDLNTRIEGFKDKITGIGEKFKKGSTENQVIVLINNMRAVVKGISAFLKVIAK